MPRQKTREEVKKEFIREINSMVLYWEKQENFSTKEKLEGLTYSILGILDGCASIPAFIVAPNPMPEERQSFIEKGEDFFPENFYIRIKSDISGDLKDVYFEQKKLIDDLKRAIERKEK